MGQTSTSWAGARVVDAARSHIKINDKDSLYHSDKLHMAPSGYERWAAWLGTAVNNPNTGCLKWLSCECAEYSAQYGDAYNHPHEATYTCAAADQAITSRAARGSRFPLTDLIILSLGLCYLSI